MWGKEAADEPALTFVAAPSGMTGGWSINYMQEHIAGRLFCNVKDRDERYSKTVAAMITLL